MKTHTKTKHHIPLATNLGVLFFLILLIQGCGGGAQNDSPDATISALSQAIAGTATAEKANEAHKGDLATAQAEATQQGLNIAATQTALYANRDEGSLATATVAAPIVAELPSYGLDASSGRVGWIHDPLTLEIQGEQQFGYGNDFMEVTAKNFVLASDVTWNTKYGESGCGFMFRSDGDNQKPNQYMILATRYTGGRVIFTALADGELANIKDFYPKSEDRSFQWENDTTNRFTIVARDNLIEIYTNMIKIGEIDTTQPPEPISMPPTPMPPIDTSNSAAQDFYEDQVKAYKQIAEQTQQNYQTAYANYLKTPAIYTDGFLSMLAFTQGGLTKCEFDNTWLWLLEP